MNEIRSLTGNCVSMSKEMLECVYKFCILPHAKQQRRGSRKIPQCDVTVCKTCCDDAKKTFTLSL